MICYQAIVSYWLERRKVYLLSNKIGNEIVRICAVLLLLSLCWCWCYHNQHKSQGRGSLVLFWLKPLVPFATRSNERTKNVTQNTVQRHHAHHDCIIFSDLFLPGVAVIDRCVNECVPNYSVIFIGSFSTSLSRAFVTEWISNDS